MRADVRSPKATTRPAFRSSNAPPRGAVRTGAEKTLRRRGR